MGGLLDELGKKLAERWLTLLVLPGALYVAALVTALTLGHTHPFSLYRLIVQLDRWIAAVNPDSVVGLAIVLLIFVLGSAACGLIAQAAGALVERWWLATNWTDWPVLLRHAAGSLVRRRQDRWDIAFADYQRAREQAAAVHVRLRLTGGNAPEVPQTGELDIRRRSLMRIGTERPERPTWMGDRLNEIAARIDRDLDLDLATIWPYLWLTGSDAARTEITEAREALGRATTLAGWGMLYAAVGALWWPCLPAAAIVILTARQRARAASDTYASLVDATIRLRTASLAQELGLEHDGPLTRDVGRALSSLLGGSILPGHVPVMRSGPDTARS